MGKMLVRRRSQLKFEKEGRRIIRIEWAKKETGLSSGFLMIWNLFGLAMLIGR